VDADWWSVGDLVFSIVRVTTTKPERVVKSCRNHDDENYPPAAGSNSNNNCNNNSNNMPLSPRMMRSSCLELGERTVAVVAAAAAAAAGRHNRQSKTDKMMDWHRLLANNQSRAPFE
jgi:hypothetical protein